LKYRKANLDDIQRLFDLRKEQLIDEGIEPNIDIDMELSKFLKVKMKTEVHILLGLYLCFVY
jgi:hypothetical protein